MTATLCAGAAGDIDAVLRIMDAAFDPAFGEAWNRGQVLGILSLSDVWLTLVTPHGSDLPEGFALARLTLDEAELLLLAVRPIARGAGLGRMLVEAIAGEAAERRATRLMLEMRDGNPALGLYMSAGFAQIGHRRNYYRGRDMSVHDAITLARPLGTLPQSID